MTEAKMYHGYIGEGRRVHCILGGFNHRWALCGSGGKVGFTKKPVTCKTCLRQNAILEKMERVNEG